MKPTIRKAGGRWVLTRPAFGFACSDEVTLHESWKAAKDALLGDAVGSAGPLVERGHFTFRSDYWGSCSGHDPHGGDMSSRRCACGAVQPCGNSACQPPQLPPPPPPPPPQRFADRMEEGT